MNTLEDRIRTAVTQTAEEIAPGPSAAGNAGGG